MIRILKQRWVIAVLAVGATLLFITYVYPKIKSALCLLKVKMSAYCVLYRSLLMSILPPRF